MVPEVDRYDASCSNFIHNLEYSIICNINIRLLKTLQYNTSVLIVFAKTNFRLSKCNDYPVIKIKSISGPNSQQNNNIGFKHPYTNGTKCAPTQDAY